MGLPGCDVGSAGPAVCVCRAPLGLAASQQQSPSCHPAAACPKQRLRPRQQRPGHPRPLRRAWRLCTPRSPAPGPASECTAAQHLTPAGGAGLPQRWRRQRCSRLLPHAGQALQDSGAARQGSSPLHSSPLHSCCQLPLISDGVRCPPPAAGCYPPSRPSDPSANDQGLTGHPPVPAGHSPADSSTGAGAAVLGPERQCWGRSGSAGGGWLPGRAGWPQRSGRQ